MVQDPEFVLSDASGRSQLAVGPGAFFYTLLKGCNAGDTFPEIVRAFQNFMLRDDVCCTIVASFSSGPYGTRLNQFGTGKGPQEYQSFVAHYTANELEAIWNSVSSA